MVTVEHFLRSEDDTYTEGKTSINFRPPKPDSSAESRRGGTYIHAMHGRISMTMGGGGGGSCGAGGCTNVVHCRSRMAIPYHVGTEHVGLLPTRQTLLAPTAKHREVLGRMHEG